eukprot:COSAG05_NODE_5004_length_1295_cov_1.056020_1_plen_147_part_10
MHCQSGVSRSCSLVIAYLMWKEGLEYDSALAKVKAHRIVASPNMAFRAALQQWQRCRTGELAPSPTEAPWIYQVCRQGEANFSGPLVARRILPTAPAPSTTAANAVTADQLSGGPGLDPRGFFLVRSAKVGLVGWQGQAASAGLALP